MFFDILYAQDVDSCNIQELKLSSESFRSVRFYRITLIYIVVTFMVIVNARLIDEISAM